MNLICPSKSFSRFRRLRLRNPVSVRLDFCEVRTFVPVMPINFEFGVIRVAVSRLVTATHTGQSEKTGTRPTHMMAACRQISSK